MVSRQSINVSSFIIKLFTLVSGIRYANGQIIPDSHIVSEAFSDFTHEISSEDFFTKPDDVYDFIVVGGGSGGCVIAGRLSEVKEWKVLLLEAGGDENVINDIPLPAYYQQLTPLNWDYRSEPSDKYCLGMDNQQCRIPRGKIMGGTSVFNYMVYARGHKEDFNNWETKLGNTGWSYEDVLPYFKKSEDMEIPEFRNDQVYHSTDGPLTVSYAPYRSPIGEAFVNATLEKRLKHVDYNGETLIGSSFFQYTMKNGSRWSATRAFIDPVRSRSNLHIRKRSLVTKVILDKNNTAIGVEFVHGFTKYVVKARKEVIMAAGAFNTPQLLMLSGIGPSDHLEEMGITVAQNLSVGYNLMDHVSSLAFMFFVNDSVGYRTDYTILKHPENIANYALYKEGPVTLPVSLEAVAFLDTKNPSDTNSNPDIELFFVSATIVSDPAFKKVFGISDDLYNKVYKQVEDRFGWFVLPILLHPKSRGRIILKSTDPKDKPLINPNFFSEEEDLDTIVSGIKVLLDINNAMALQRYNSKLHDVPLPQCSDIEFGSDDYWKCAIRTLTCVVHHWSGSCKMGPSTDPDAVVDPSSLKVHGISRLRIADASVIPDIPACHTNAVVYMIAERCADFIKKDWGK